MLAVTTVSVLSLDQSADFFYINLLTHYSTSRKRKKNQDWYSHSGKEPFFLSFRQNFDVHWSLWLWVLFCAHCSISIDSSILNPWEPRPMILNLIIRRSTDSVVISRSLTMRWLNGHNHITDRIVIVIAAIMIAIYSEEARFDLFEVVNSEKPPIRRVELIIDSWDFFLFQDSIINSSSRFNLAKTELRKKIISLALQSNGLFLRKLEIFWVFVRN